jgi:hypothetical protein
MARMLNDPAYAALLVDGSDEGTGEQVPGTLTQRFRDQVLATHRATNGVKDSGGRWQLPWPRALGTQPWALAREMTRAAGRRGKTYGVVPVRPSQRRAVFERLVSLSADGEAVPLYVGNRWSPRHVVLVLPSDIPRADSVQIYDPANGRRYPITAADFIAGRLVVAGWSLPWCVVVPAST